MNISDILNITKNFYKNIGQEFSDTRKYAWKGWGSVLEKIELFDNCEILDLGCGNGRFYDFLYQNLKYKFKYLGLDINEELLSIATDNYPNGEFKKEDIFENIKNINKKYDLVVGFGITHHLPNKNFRFSWFEHLAELVNTNGYIVLSFWNFLDKKSLEAAENLEKNDYWLSWGDKDVKRFCHFYDEEELQEIDALLKNNDLDLISEIKNEQDLNIYKIYKKR